jgi:putative membrane protein
MQATQLPVSYGTVFLAGAIAISAMLLPGISGSFLLLLMGMYQPVIEAIVSADIATLAVFVAGCLVGLIGFSRLLKTLMRTAGRATMAVLYGFLLGSMITLWPWQRTVSSVVDRHGELRIVQSLPVSPAHYADTVGDPLLLLCAIAFISGLIAVWFLSSHARSGQ